MNAIAKLHHQLFTSSHSDLVKLAQEKKINVFNRLGGYLPHCTLQDILFSIIIRESPSDYKPEPEIKRNWYALFVRYGKEQSTVHAIVEQMKLNAVPDFKRNVDSGLITSDFRLDNIILDIAYPHEFAIASNMLVENYKSYIFIEIDDLYRRNLFYNIIEPFFKNINDVVGFVGLHLKSDVRLKQQYSKQGRSVLRFYNDKITVPVNVSFGDYQGLHRSNSSVSVFEESDYQPNEPVWFVTSVKHKAKYWVVKMLDHDTYQIRTKQGFKFPASATMLRKFDG